MARRDARRPLFRRNGRGSALIKSGSSLLPRHNALRRRIAAADAAVPRPSLAAAKTLLIPLLPWRHVSGPGARPP